MRQKKTRFSLLQFTTWEKHYRSIITLSFLAIWTLCMYLFGQHQPILLPTEETPLFIYANQVGDNLQNTLSEAINSAKKSIVIVIFSLTDNQIISILRKKAEEGIDVTIICDAVATSPDINFKLGNKVKVFKRRTRGLMHDKLMSIDCEEAWTGSANLTRDSLLKHANIMVGVHSQQLAEAIEKKAFEFAKGTSYKAPPYTLTTTNNQKLDLFFLPDYPKAVAYLENLIRTSQKTIRVAMFTFTHEKLLEALISAHKRGVSVEVVLDEDSAKNTSSKVFQRLKREKMNVFVSDRDGLLHYKMMIVDNIILTTGSANWTKAAFTANDDNLFIIENLTKEQQTKLENVWKMCLQEAKSTFSSKKERTVSR